MSEETTAVPALEVRRSENIAALVTALSAAQGSLEGAKKDSNNPHFKNDYADLASCWNACREALAKNGLAVIQSPVADGTVVTVRTLLAHKSGEWIESDLTMMAGQNTPQAIGSCITYARRYALSAMVGIAPEDDDGNDATKPGDGGRRTQPPAAKAPAKPQTPPTPTDKPKQSNEERIASFTVSFRQAMLGHDTLEQREAYLGTIGEKIDYLRKNAPAKLNELYNYAVENPPVGVRGDDEPKAIVLAQKAFGVDVAADATFTPPPGGEA